MSAIHPTCRHLEVLAVALVLSAAVPARAELASHSFRGEATVLACVDGELHPVAARSSNGDVRLDAARGVQLCVVDLAEQALPATAVDFALERNQNLRLEVLDLEGNLVRTLAQGLWAAGRHQLAWQHDAESGDRLDEGLYVVRLVPEAAEEMVALAR